MKILLTISGDDISARLDMTREVLVVKSKKGTCIGEPKTILLGKSSAEDICSFIIKENISCLICGGIEEKHYKYLRWKKIKVIDSIIGPHKEALQLLFNNKLQKGSILAGARKQDTK